MLEKNPAIDEAVTKIYMLTQDDIIREQMEAEELYYHSIRNRDKAIAGLKLSVKEKDRQNEELLAENERLKSINTLYKWLLDQGRIEDVQKATTDEEFQKALFAEMELAQKG